MTTGGVIIKVRKNNGYQIAMKIITTCNGYHVDSLADILTAIKKMPSPKEMHDLARKSNFGKEGCLLQYLKNGGIELLYDKKDFDKAALENSWIWDKELFCQIKINPLDIRGEDLDDLDIVRYEQ